jgi:hypothetical protein
MSRRNFVDRFAAFAALLCRVSMVTYYSVVTKKVLDTDEYRI